MSKKPVLPFLVALGVLAPATALAAPRVGVVVLSHLGFTEQTADDISYDLAGVIATQIEGEAIAGTSVRSKLTDKIEVGCESNAECGRNVAKTIDTDEVLFLSMRKVPVGSKKWDVAIDAVRVPRDASREPTSGKLRLSGPKMRRQVAISQFVTTLYPAGTVAAYTEPPAVTKTPQEADAGSRRPNFSARPPTDEEVAPHEPEGAKNLDGEAAPKKGDGVPVYKKGWFWGVMAGAAVVVAGGIVGIVILERPGPSAPSIQLPGL